MNGIPKPKFHPQNGIANVSSHSRLQVCLFLYTSFLYICGGVASDTMAYAQSTRLTVGSFLNH